MTTKREVRKYLEELDEGLVSWVYEPELKPHSKYPDILACINGRFVALVVQRTARRPAFQISKTLVEIEDKGGVVGVVSSLSDVARIVQGLGFGDAEEINFMVRHKRLRAAYEEMNQ